MYITLLIIVLTCITSITALNNPAVKQQLVFSPYIIHHRKEWYRFISSGFIHGDWPHLIFNMIVLYLFGSKVEGFYEEIFGRPYATFYILLYILSIVLSEVYTYFRYQNFPGFQSLGASGAVTAILFSSILIEPFSKIGLLFLPIGIPGFIFGLLYLLYCMQMAGKQLDNQNHYAHFYGAVFGFLFPIVLKPELFMDFIHKFTHGY